MTCDAIVESANSGAVGPCGDPAGIYFESLWRGLRLYFARCDRHPMVGWGCKEISYDEFVVASVMEY